MCGEEMVESPYGGFSVPPECVELMQNADEYAPDDIYDKTKVDLCSEHASEARDIIDRGDTPLTVCDARFCRITDEEGAEREAALLSMHRDDVDVDDLKDDLAPDDLTERMVQDALMTVKMHLDGDDGHLLDSDVYEAKAIVLSMKELGYIG